MATQIEKLYRRHYDRMLLTARTLLGNDEEARDVVGDVFAELLTTARQLRDEQAESYLLVSVRNRCMNLLEHRRIVKESEQTIPHDIMTTEHEEPPLEQVLDYVDTHLTAKTSRVVKNRFLGRMKYDEIAQDMGISRVAVYKHLSQGIRQLKVHFAWYYVVVLFLLLSGLAYAIILQHRQKEPSPDRLTDTTELPAPEAAAPTVVHYEGAALEEIMTDIARYHHAGLQFRSEAARRLRLHYDWHQREDLSEIVQTLDAFENIAMEYHDNTIYVE